MLTILAADKILQIQFAFAQEDVQSSQIVIKEPIEVVIREPVRTRITEWSAFPSQAIKVKIDDPWPAQIKIRDEVEVKGELRLRD
jgi:hypothetical protein